MSANGSIELLIAFMRRRLSRTEMRAFILAVTEDAGTRVTVPDDRRAWTHAASIVRRVLDERTAMRYLAELQRRDAARRPLIRQSIVAAVRRRYAGPPRSGDEFEERLRRLGRASFEAQHEANRQGSHYAKLRAARLKVAGGKCESCSSRTGLELHHVHYETLGRETTKDVRILCNVCHVRETSRQRALRRARWRGGWGRRRVRLYG